NQLLAEFLRHLGRSSRRRKSERVCVFGVNPDHVPHIGQQRVAAAQRLHHPQTSSRLQAMRYPTGNLGGVNVTRQDDLFSCCHSSQSTRWKPLPARRAKPRAERARPEWRILPAAETLILRQTPPACPALLPRRRPSLSPDHETFQKRLPLRWP